MKIPAPRARRYSEDNVIPMINVVFLLLIFFLMTAQIAPPDSLDVTLPKAERAAPGDSDLTLYVGADGTLAFRDVTGDPQALDALEAAYRALCPQAACATSPQLVIRADTALAVRALPPILRALAARQITDIALATQPGPPQPGPAAQ